MKDPGPGNISTGLALGFETPGRVRRLVLQINYGSCYNNCDYGKFVILC